MLDFAEMLSGHVPHAFHAEAAAVRGKYRCSFRCYSKCLSAVLDTMEQWGYPVIDVDKTRWRSVVVIRAVASAQELKHIEDERFDEATPAAILESVRRALPLSLVSEVARYHNGDYALSVNVKVNQAGNKVEAKVSGALKRSCVGESCVDSTREPDMPGLRSCADCGADISHLDDYCRYCEDCYEERYLDN